MSIFAVTSPMPLVPPIITTFLPWYRSICILLTDFELFYMIFRHRGCAQGIFEINSSKMPWEPVDELIAPQSPADSGRRNHFAATGAPSGQRTQGCWARQVGARDLDDGPPRGFLTGAIVEVRVALRLNWACELPLSRGEELP
jgi:hypothetical protein